MLVGGSANIKGKHCRHAQNLSEYRGLSQGRGMAKDELGSAGKQEGITSKGFQQSISQSTEA